MNSSDYWFPWFPTVFRAKTMHLTDMQELWYRRLIDHYMVTREPLPDNDAALCKIANASYLSDLDALSMLKAFFTPKKGLLFHDFCDNQLDIMDKKSKNRSDIAKKAAEKRWRKNDAKQEDKCIEHASSSHLAMLGDATGQDITGRKNPPISPKNRFSEFWDAYPNQRKGSKEKAAQAYAKALKRAEEETILRALAAYAKSDEVKRGFAKGAAAWLNDDRWTYDYGQAPVALPKKPRPQDIDPNFGREGKVMTQEQLDDLLRN